MLHVELINGVKMPIMGLGTYPMRGDILKNAVKFCYENGYELYDSAWYYRNEKTLGDCFKRLGIPRENLFVISKLKAEQYLGQRRYFHLNKRSVAKCYQDTLLRYDLPYIDLYLMHSYIDWYMEAYADVIKLYEEGKVRAIGACNCTIEQLKRFKTMHGVYPMVNQIEMHPYYNRKELVDFCQENDIQVMAFSPFAHGDYLHELLSNPVLIALAKKYNKSITQIILRWFVQNEIAVIPQSKSPNHIKENIDIFNFSMDENDLRKVDSLDKDLSYGSFSQKNQRTFLGINIGH